MSKYATSTDVTADRSRSEIERTLTKYGARQFAYGWDENRAILGFVADERQVRFTLPMPDRADYTRTPTGRARTTSSANEAFEQAVRQRWRALALVIKAKLEAVDLQRTCGYVACRYFLRLTSRPQKQFPR